MPANPKLYLPNHVHFLSARTEQGLPFVAAQHLKLVLEGILARATEKYNVTLCHQLWMANHFHMLVVVRDPEALADFICFVKTESAHAVNRLLGRKRRTVWCAGSDAPVLLTAEDVIRKIAYIYANPARAGLVDSIDEYPMVSSWEMFRAKRYIKQCPVITRDKIPKLGSKHLSLRNQKAFSTLLKNSSECTAKLTIAPYAWMDCFSEMRGASRFQVDDLILFELRSLEQHAREGRSGKPLGSLALRTQDIDESYEPKKFSNKMICICAQKTLRLEFLGWAKALFTKARKVYAQWKKGNFNLKYPPGMFSPRKPRAANMLVPH